MSVTGYWGKSWDKADLRRALSRQIDIRVQGQILKGEITLEEKLRQERDERLRVSGVPCLEIARRSR